MKTFLYLIGFFLIISCSTDDDAQTVESQQQDDAPEIALTLIPDPVFEQLLVDLSIDNEVDGAVRTSAVENVTELVLNDKGITDVTGIASFKNLYNLWLNDNELESLNVSQNTKLKFVYAVNNNISSLSVSSLPELEKIGMGNNNLTTINVDNNLNLQILEVSGNDISNIKVANNTALTTLDVRDNPLTCIEVSPTQLSNIPSRWEKDTNDSYSVNCN